MYMCVCTYFSLIKIGMLTFYALTPRQTSSVSLLMICSYVQFTNSVSLFFIIFYILCFENYMFSHDANKLRMVARYAPPISYNFLNLINLENGATTTFEKVCGIVYSVFSFVSSCIRIVCKHDDICREWEILMMQCHSLGMDSTEFIHSLWLSLPYWWQPISSTASLDTAEIGKYSIINTKH